MVVSFILSCAALVEALRDPSAHLVHVFDWFVLGETTFKLGWVLDPLTAAMVVMITFVGTLIFVFSLDDTGDRTKEFVTENFHPGSDVRNDRGLEEVSLVASSR